MDSRRALEAAMGYLDLGLYEDALDELDGIRGNGGDEVNAAVGMSIEIYQAMRRWSDARRLAEEMARMEPENPRWWIDWAYALRREKTIQDARGVLWEAAQVHPAVELIHYNLSCYACVLGEMDEARRLLRKAATLDPGVLEMAKKDEDLKELWGELEDWWSA